jgi:hypothetical protein
MKVNCKKESRSMVALTAKGAREPVGDGSAHLFDSYGDYMYIYTCQTYYLYM